MTDLRVVDLRVDGLRVPIGIGNPTPRFSWRLETRGARDVRQTAYQVRVFGEGDGEPRWSSGRITSRESIGVRYAGPTLRSREQYRWSVRVWDGAGLPTSWSDASSWEMGLLDRGDWTARWISTPDPETVPDVEGIFRPSPAPIFRTGLVLDEAPIRARVYVTALGLYEARINGARVGEHVLAPGWTDYHRRIQYQTYDVTDLLTPGPNAVGVLLGDGWYCGHVASLGRHIYGDAPAVLLQLEVITAGGERVTAATDQAWRTAPSGIASTDLLMGEVEDARAWPDGWDLPGFDDGQWAPAVLHAGTGADLVAPVDPGTTIVESLRPARIEQRDGTSIVDLGQNMAGRVRLEVDVPGGTAVTLRHAEVLDADDDLYTTNLKTAMQTDTYVARPGPQRFEPRFTYHGFRYVGVSGLPEGLRPDQITGRLVSANLERTGTFTCSDPMLDQLQRNIVWGLRSNFVSIPTDCPQRDERLGWTADAQIVAPTAAFNLDVLPFFRKWLIDLEDAQRPSGAYPDVAPGAIYGGVGNAGWGDAGIILPWDLHVRYGVTDLLERHYEGMRRHLEFLLASSTGYVRSAGRYGDWLSLEGITPKAVIGTAFLAHCADLMASIAGALGDHQARSEYEALHGSIRNAFVDRFVEGDGSIAGRTQVGHVLALHMHLVPDDLRSATARLLAADVEAREGHLATGFLGTAFALPVLSDHGYHELACRVAQQRTFPSWGFQIEHGATTIWERWDGWTAERGFADERMNSFNHYALGSVGDWLYRYIGGLDPDPDHPGYRHARIRPRPGGTIRSARLSHDSPYGRWEVDWQVTEGDFQLDVTVPPNATAEVILPADASAVHDEEGKSLPSATTTVDGTSVLVGSGRYTFRAMNESWASRAESSRPPVP